MEKPKLDPTAMTAEELAGVFTSAGKKIAAEQIRRDVADGAPTNADGRLHLVHYAAWLAGQIK